MNLQEIDIKIDESKCIGCNSCVMDCPSKVLRLENNKAKLTSTTCLKCAHCFSICPTHAIHFDGTKDSVIEMDTDSFLKPEELIKHLKLRRSVRHFKQDIPTNETISQIIEAGRLTPSASNKQNVRYIVINKDINVLEDLGIQEYKQMQELSKLGKLNIPKSLESASFDRGFLFQKAPCLILTVSTSSESATLAAMNMELMLESLGLACVFVGLFTRPANQSEVIRNYLNIGDKETIVNCLAIGYPSIQYQRSAPKLQANITWNVD